MLRDITRCKAKDNILSQKLSILQSPPDFATNSFYRSIGPFHLLWKLCHHLFTQSELLELENCALTAQTLIINSPLQRTAHLLGLIRARNPDVAWPTYSVLSENASWSDRIANNCHFLGKLDTNHTEEYIILTRDNYWSPQAKRYVTKCYIFRNIVEASSNFWTGIFCRVRTTARNQSDDPGLSCAHHRPWVFPGKLEPEAWVTPIYNLKRTKCASNCTN